MIANDNVNEACQVFKYQWNYVYLYSSILKAVSKIKQNT